MLMSHRYYRVYKKKRNVGIIEIFAHFRLYNYLFEDKHNFNNMN